MPTRPQPEAKSVTFKIGVEGKPDGAVDNTLYAFDARGSLVASAPLRDGAAKLDVPASQLRRARLFVAPTLPEDRAQSPTPQTMERIGAYEPTWRFERERASYELLPIPERLWHLWGWCSCRVRGRVLKVETLGGVTYERRVCHARVHVCEVDRLPWIILQLPDPVITRLRDELIAAIERPFPVDPNPPDPPFRIDPGVFAATSRATRAAGVLGRLEAVAFNPQPDPPLTARLTNALERVALNPQPLPPKASSVMPLELRSALAASSPRLLRDALVANVHLLRPYWCRWDWLEPYIRPFYYQCDELAVVETDENGRFDTTVWYRCGDQPDLYFWVEYSVGGSWETVYHPPIRCNTWWNYVCGSEVTIRLHDPRVRGCDDRPEVLGKKVVVKTIGRQVSMGEIYRQSAVPALAAREGQVREGWIDATKPSPFGATLEPRVDFGSGLAGAGITHYRWSYRTLGSTSEADWRVIDEPVSRHYRVATPPGSPTIYSSVQIGPDTALTGYYAIIDPVLPSNGEDWEVLDEGYDLASAHFDTTGLSPGKYELKLELFKIVAGVPQRVVLRAAGAPSADVEVYEIIDPAPLVEGSYTTTPPTADRLLNDASANTVAYRLVLHVDNRVCFGTINDVTVNGIPAGRCGFLEYNALTDTANVSFRASHPANFASFSFELVRVTTQVAEGTASGLVDDATAGGFARTGDTFSTTPPLSIDTLMRSGLPPGETPCVRAAFAEWLHVYALATNGYDRLSGLDAPRPGDPAQVHLRAFAITAH